MHYAIKVKYRGNVGIGTQIDQMKKYLLVYVYLGSSGCCGWLGWLKKKC